LNDLFSDAGEVYNRRRNVKLDRATGVEKVDNRSLTQGVIVRIAFGVFGLLTIAMLLLATFNDKGALQVHAQANKLHTIEADINKLDAENKQLSGEIQGLRTDPTTIERFAREELKLVKPGEVVLVTPEK
jgi:cell division protein FtsB